MAEPTGICSYRVKKESAGIQLEPRAGGLPTKLEFKESDLPPQKILILLTSNKNVRPS